MEGGPRGKRAAGSEDGAAAEGLVTARLRGVRGRERERVVVRREEGLRVSEGESPAVKVARRRRRCCCCDGRWGEGKKMEVERDGLRDCAVCLAS